MLWILLDNACRHSRASGPISVRLWSESGWARTEVADAGPGISPADLERVFERFHRADRARSGTGAGLGLSIARGLVLAQGGRIIARVNAGGGASLHVDLPLLSTS